MKKIRTRFINLPVGRNTALSSMIEKIEVQLKKERYVGKL